MLLSESIPLPSFAVLFTRIMHFQQSFPKPPSQIINDKFSIQTQRFGCGSAALRLSFFALRPCCIVPSKGLCAERAGIFHPGRGPPPKEQAVAIKLYRLYPDQAGAGVFPKRRV